ncbi:NUDIX domain-containing protein [Butyrivibrio proteoclasticus B316]|uniref:NUDIX domain-containing protein n=1 Tax=Butyrivibrio proteoclasticus (strain ATCC 51982 / DSM 14932 / B316) TaxID=515622 RepID=E0S235_BUTPB|nr:NUDIX domain-containing protein [Butyrivibrio proteoclasticus]ADL33860.1 NUDIX domain-containing protein [Butyrivibrio proteoclasticus B316]
MDELKKSIKLLERTMRESGVDPEKGLGTELFLMVSSMTPIVNVDLFITDEKGRLLLSWRDDRYCGQGWHIPGGCLRFKEKLEDRIKQTAIKELGTEVTYDNIPMAVLENIANDYKTVVENNNVRSHFLSVLYKCKCNDVNKIIDCDGKREVGHLKWFGHLPEDFIDIQYYYKPVITDWFNYHRP